MYYNSLSLIYVLYKNKNTLTLVIIGYIVGLMIGMYIEYCLWAQVAVLDIYILHILEFLGQVNAGFIQVLYLGRAPRTKETLLDFREKCRVTRHSRVFCGLTGSQRTLGFGASQILPSFGLARPFGFNLPGLGGPKLKRFELKSKTLNTQHETLAFKVIIRVLPPIEARRLEEEVCKIRRPKPSPRALTRGLSGGT